MGRKFIGHAASLDRSGKLHQFEPGDLVPDWLEDLVGEDLAPASEDASPDFTKQDAEDVTESEDDKGSPEAEAETEDDADDATAETASEDAAPDFTKPAPAKRRTTRKQA